MICSLNCHNRDDPRTVTLAGGDRNRVRVRHNWIGSGLVVNCGCGPSGWPPSLCACWYQAGAGRRHGHAAWYKWVGQASRHATAGEVRQAGRLLEEAWKGAKVMVWEDQMERDGLFGGLRLELDHIGA